MRDSLYYPRTEDTTEVLSTTDILTGLRLQHAEPRTTHYQPRVLDTESVEVKNADRPEGVDNPTVMEIDEDQSQPPPNQGTHCSTRTSQPPKDIILQMLGTLHTPSKCPCTRPQSKCLVVPRGTTLTN